MSDLISRAALLDTLRKRGRELSKMSLIRSERIIAITTVHECIGLLQDAPAVDAEPVRRGRWIGDENGAVCTFCNTPLPYVQVTDAEYGEVCVQCEETKHCPNCGARMDLEE